MEDGIIKTLTREGFGFIQRPNGMHILFQSSAVEGVRYEDLHEGQKVTFVEAPRPKGPRAEHVAPFLPPRPDNSQHGAVTTNLTMAEGTIKKLTREGFGYIQRPNGGLILFQSSAVEGVRYEDLHDGQKVTFVESPSPRGLHAEHVAPFLPPPPDNSHQGTFTTKLTMAEGTIKTLTRDGFGFIQRPNGMHILFQSSAVEGVRYEDLQEGQKVTFVEGQTPKGPRAERVAPA